MPSSPQPTRLAIGELAAEVGVAPSALRYYEELGLLEPAERRAGRRYYDAEQIGTVGAVLFLRDVGFTLGEIKALRSAVANTEARESMLRRKLDELDHRRDELEAARVALEHSLGCPADDISTCPNFRNVVRERLEARRSWTAWVTSEPATADERAQNRS